MKLRYKLVEQGSVFSTRSRGVRMLTDLESRVSEAQGPIVLDFEGVKHVSYSFADEFVGKLMQRAHDTGSPLPELVNIDQRTVYDVIELNLRSRDLDSAQVLLAPA
ncbi:MAG: hypothetical protein QOH12_3027 [Solirubrobacteraceae bacterium]|nr:hypothetical protein [Solirubrobacteraceae bacterium]